jgi:hypothetical protein
MVESTFVLGLIERRDEGEIKRFRLEIITNNERTEANFLQLIMKRVS